MNQRTPRTLRSAGTRIEADRIGRVETLPMPPSAHCVWVSDPPLERMPLIDLESERTHG